MKTKFDEIVLEIKKPENYLNFSHIASELFVHQDVWKKNNIVLILSENNKFFIEFDGKILDRNNHLLCDLIKIETILKDNKNV